MRNILPALIFFSLISGSAARGQDLRQRLEGAYHAWRNAIQKNDFEAWRKATAWHRQILTKNLIISQRRPFPKSVFGMRVQPPSLSGLKHLKSEQKGRTATSAYLGKVIFGKSNQSVPPGLLMLHFVHERKAWRFDRSTCVNLRPMPEVNKQLTGGNLSFLKQAGFAPTGIVPKPAKQVAMPDHIADVHVVSIGYDTTVEINGTSKHNVDNNVNTEVVIGGLKTGDNPIKITTREAPVGRGEKRVFKASVYIKTGDRKNPAIKVFEYAPDNPPPNHSGTVHVSTKLFR